MKQYNIAVEDLNTMLNLCNNSCSLCERAEVKLSVDHDHRCCPGKTSCGKCIRGLLCSACNSGVAKFQDNPRIIEMAIQYLGREIFDTRQIPDECGGWSDKFYSGKWHSYRLGKNRLRFLMDSQNGQCGVCSLVFSDRKFSVDHDHKCCDDEITCGSCVRGLLCQKCNLGLGYAKDNINTLKNMIEYLVNP